MEKATGICDNRVQTILDEETALAAISDPNSIRGTLPLNRTELIQTAPDIAYILSVRAVLSINTGQLFPEGFPTDFSILSTFKPLPDSRSVLFSVYNDAGDEQLAIEIDDRIHLIYHVTHLPLYYGHAFVSLVNTLFYTRIVKAIRRN